MICGYGGSNFLGGTVVANLSAISIDGATHQMSCTFVSGVSPLALTYVTKTMSVTASGDDHVYISNVDFGGAYGESFSNFNLSVTCNLPAQVSIINLQNLRRVDVGN